MDPPRFIQWMVRPDYFHQIPKLLQSSHLKLTLINPKKHIWIQSKTSQPNYWKYTSQNEYECRGVSSTNSKEDPDFCYLHAKQGFDASILSKLVQMATSCQLIYPEPYVIKQHQSILFSQPGGINWSYIIQILKDDQITQIPDKQLNQLYDWGHYAEKTELLYRYFNKK
jgi:hypothetical protein